MALYPGPGPTAQQQANLKKSEEDAKKKAKAASLPKPLAPGSIGPMAGASGMAQVQAYRNAGTVKKSQQQYVDENNADLGIAPVGGYETKQQKQQGFIDQAKGLEQADLAKKEAAKKQAQLSQTGQDGKIVNSGLTAAYEKARQAAGGTLNFAEWQKSQEAQKIMGTPEFKQVQTQQKELTQANKKMSGNVPMPEKPTFTGEETPEEVAQKKQIYAENLADYQKDQKNAIGEQANIQASDFQSQLNQKQQEIQSLTNSLNAKQPGLGDQVNSVLQEMAQSGFQGELTPEVLAQIEQVASSTPPDQLSNTINNISDSAPAQGQEITPPIPTEIPVSKKQEYQSLSQSGMNAGQIVQQNPALLNQVKPDGTIINPNAGVGLIQTPMGEAYKLPSGLIVPRDSSTGFANLSALSQDDLKKLSYSDVLSINLSTQQTASDLKAFYSATMLQQMGQRNDREYGIASLELEKSYNSENNRLNESQVKVMQDLEIEKMRQDLSKDTSLKQLSEAKSKTMNFMAAQMDAYGLEGSTAALKTMGAYSLKFEQEASSITQAYDINIKEMAMASTQAQMQFTNRVTELNQNMMTQKLGLQNDYLNRKDEIDNSVLLSKNERITEQQNMYAEYAAKTYDAEQQAQAAAKEEEEKMQKDIWEKQKFYSEQMGMMVTVGEDGAPTPLLDEYGSPILSLSGRTSNREDSKYQLDVDKFEQDKAQFGMTYALDQQRAAIEGGRFGLEQNKFSFDKQQYYDSFSQFDDISYNEDTGTYWGKGPKGLTDLGPDFGKLGVAKPTKGIFETNVNGPGEIRFDVPLGKARSQAGRGQCGALVNDALFGGGGKGGFGNSITDDLSRLGNSTIPVAGGAFMMWTGESAGHKGLIEKVNKKDPSLPATPDNIESIEILHNNYDNAETTQRDTIYPGDDKWNSIMKAGEKNTKNPGAAFFDPVKGGVAQRGGPSGGNGDYAKMVKENKAAGMDDKTAKEVATAQYKSQQAGLTDAQSASFNALNFANEAVNRYSSLTKGKDPVKWAESMSVLNRMSLDPEKPFSAEQINKLKLSPEVQQAVNAEASFIQAVLRKESGAAISAGEYVNYGNQFFPRKGDSAQVIKDKENLRNLKVQSLKQQVGPAGLKAFENLPNSSSSQSSSLSVDDLKKDTNFMAKYKSLNNSQKTEIEKMIKKGASGNDIMNYAGYSPSQNQSVSPPQNSGYSFGNSNQSSQFSNLFD